MVLLIILITAVVIDIVTIGHILLNKRDPRGAIGWIGFTIVVPFCGALCYWFFGIARIAPRRMLNNIGESDIPLPDDYEQSIAPLFTDLTSCQHLLVSDQVTNRPVVNGNSLSPLFNGDEAYPIMLEAVRTATSRIYLSTYIFESNHSGKLFIDELLLAKERGVDVRVIIDWVGEKYSIPKIGSLLKKAGIPFIRFLPPGLHSRGFLFNLRNHRKLLLIDGHTGFTGGMNIGNRHLMADGTGRKQVVDIHFCVEGPVVSQMEATFREDWFLNTGTELPPVDYCIMENHGGTLCRGISSGPTDGYEKLHWVILSMLNSATRSVRIMTPYFIPNRAIISALNSASLRGVRVDIILPANNNLFFINWASQAHLMELIPFGVNAFFQPGPFVHSKLLLVDNSISFIGSANFDNRSFYLNFEFNLEVYDRRFTTMLVGHFDAVRERSRQITLRDLDQRSLTLKLRDATVKLFSPYL